MDGSRVAHRQSAKRRTQTGHGKNLGYEVEDIAYSKEVCADDDADMAAALEKYRDWQLPHISRPNCSRLLSYRHC